MPTNVARNVMAFLEPGFILELGCKFQLSEKITRYGYDCDIWSGGCDYGMWRYAAHTAGNRCEAPKALAVAVPHSHRLDLGSTFSVRAPRLVPLL